MARELERVAPTPAEKFRLMLGQRPTPRTDASRVFVHMTPDPNATPVEFVYAATCETLERELAEAREQRDRLAIALDRIASGRFDDLACMDLAQQALDQVKGEAS